ncbi:metalloendopeptidase [Aureococcus anophagefferens]|nr:metalloendopeptidase [Aureococcus anophagefferens]
MCDILDFLGRDLLTVKAAFEDECRVGERKSSLRAAAPRSNDDDDIDRLVLPLAGAMRALRRAGVDLTGRSAEEWCGYWGVDGRVGFEFDDFLYLYDACARRRAWATTRERHHGGPFNAATAGSRLVPRDDLAGRAAPDDGRPAAARGPARRSAALYARTSRVAAALDVPPHYPVDIAQFRRIVDELDAGGARDADLRRQSWVDKDQQRRAAAAARYRESRAGAANAGTFCDAEPLMDPETRAIRRSAVRARHRRAHGREIDDPGVY